jgi:hypothetical protein
MPVNLPNPMVVRPAQAEVIGDKLWIESLVIDASPLDDNKITITAMVRPYALINGEKVFSLQARKLTCENVMAKIDADVTNGKTSWYNAMSAIYLAMEEFFADVVAAEANESA